MGAGRDWWAVWWPWMLLWGLTVAALATAVAVLLVHWRRRDRAPVRHASHGVCLFLDDDAVMDLYLQGNYKPALRHEVEEKIISATDAKVSAALSGLGAAAGRSVDREIFRRYIEVAEPITVIGIITAVLEKADDIVYTDLATNTIEWGNGLDRALRSRYGSGGDLVRLRDLEVVDLFLSVRGRYQQVARTPDTITLAAWHGDPADPHTEPKISVTCHTARLRRPVPTGTFQARCLGRVQGWNPDSRQLMIDPIAMFS